VTQIWDGAQTWFVPLEIVFSDMSRGVLLEPVFCGSATRFKFFNGLLQSIYKFGLSVCLSVCLYSINVKTAEPIGQKFLWDLTWPHPSWVHLSIFAHLFGIYPSYSYKKIKCIYLFYQFSVHAPLKKLSFSFYPVFSTQFRLFSQI